MELKINISEERLSKLPWIQNIRKLLNSFFDNNIITNSQLYYQFPVFINSNNKTIISDLLFISKRHGLLFFWEVDKRSAMKPDYKIELFSKIEECTRNIYAKEIRSKILTTATFTPRVPIKSIIYPLDNSILQYNNELIMVFEDDKKLSEYLYALEDPMLSGEDIKELYSLLESTYTLKKEKPRNLEKLPNTAKGYIAKNIDDQIKVLDDSQRRSATTLAPGFQRIRGLAGSGKTILLALKAALTHAIYPNETIIYTFYTKSLYQFIKTLITKFYRDLSDKDPDFDNKLKIMHGWGGASTPGVYTEICKNYEIKPLTYKEAFYSTDSDPFDYACKDVLSKIKEEKILCDFMFIDEGQDFPLSFFNLCRQVVKDETIALAYDELQTIFQTEAPSAKAIFGDKGNFSDDIVLKTCYRCLREILVCAHAIGFGIYSDKIVQMIKDQSQWENLGYKVESGSFTEGSDIIITRPEEYSLSLPNSLSINIDEVVSALSFPHIDDESKYVVSSIIADLQDGLRPDDILVICADDRFAKTYFEIISEYLNQNNISAHNLQLDTYGIQSFTIENSVTLSTIHKAKGNEAYLVYIVGIDGLFLNPRIRERNMIFTAMTRAKAWVKISGVGMHATTFKNELDKAKHNFPSLRFKYPSEKEIKIMEKDLQKETERKIKIDSHIDSLLQTLTPEQIAELAEDRYKKQKQ